MLLLQELVKQLRTMQAADASNKALIFTQYNSTLEFVSKKLQEEGFTCWCISGKMPMKQRAAAIEAFQKSPSTGLFVLSVRCFLLLHWGYSEIFRLLLEE